MDFDLSEEQRLLKESVDGLLGSSYDFDQRKKHMAEKGGWSKSAWNKLAEQGLLGLPFAEDDGGFGAGAVETMIVMEAMGRALVLEPYLATVVIGGGFLRRGGSTEQKTAHIPGIIDGSKTFAFAQLEKNSRYDLQDVTTAAKKKGDGWVIDGEKFVVLNGESADMLVVTARAGRPACVPPPLRRRRGRRRCRDRRSRKRIAADRARGRRGPHCDVRGGG